MNMIISCLGTHRFATRKTVIRIKEHTDPKWGTHQSAQGTHLPMKSLVVIRFGTIGVIGSYLNKCFWIFRWRWFFRKYPYFMNYSTVRLLFSFGSNISFTRNNMIPQHPYIICLTIFSLLFTTPLLKGNATAFFTAPMSLSSPRAKENMHIAI